MEPLPFRTTPLERVDAPTRRAFAARHVRQRRPVILAGAARAWAEDEALSLDAIAAAGGGRGFRVYWSDDGFFPGLNAESLLGTPPEALGRRARTMSLPALVALHGRVGDPDARRACLYHRSLDELPAVAGRVGPPALVGAGAPRAAVRSNLWLSGPGAVTPCHFDLSDNLLVQVRGRKRVIVWEPARCRDLYPCPVDDVYARQSQVFDLRRADLARFPRLADADAQVGELAPGDAVYLPGCHWHHVETLTPSASVNFFWTPLDDAQRALQAFTAAAAAARAALPADLPPEMVTYALRALISAAPAGPRRR